MANTPSGGSGGRPSKQVKVIGSAASKINTPYYNQQQKSRVPDGVNQANPILPAEQAQELQDKAGA